VERDVGLAGRSDGVGDVGQGDDVELALGIVPEDVVPDDDRVPGCLDEGAVRLGVSLDGDGEIRMVPPVARVSLSIQDGDACGRDIGTTFADGDELCRPDWTLPSGPLSGGPQASLPLQGSLRSPAALGLRLCGVESSESGEGAEEAAPGGAAAEQANERVKALVLHDRLLSSPESGMGAARRHASPQRLSPQLISPWAIPARVARRAVAWTTPRIPARVSRGPKLGTRADRV
jgi:hypothetical protein